ncbi:hypothetical protein [uncultured Flavobacterium sp.]|uniref:hypothetical protein n=1 Tax=uncultured Flavobacterium sp. TaxID=165435 RepID=UPI00259ADCA5|nr:hypothetical protein [uncultured Flavobacterium sp.]
MESHAIILSTHKINNPDAISKELVSGLINDKLVQMDYFGVEPDNQADYIDGAMQEIIDRTTLINIYFESESIDYNSFSEEEIYNYAISLLQSRDAVVKSDIESNEIDIYVS